MSASQNYILFSEPLFNHPKELILEKKSSPQNDGLNNNYLILLKQVWYSSRFNLLSPQMIRKIVVKIARKKAYSL